MTGEWSGAGIVNRANGQSGGVKGAEEVNEETGISGADGDTRQRGESPHAEGGIAWPSL